MKAIVSRAGLVALFALMMASQGCLVPWRKYITLKRKYDEAVKELAVKDSQLADLNTRLDVLREQLNQANQIIKLYDAAKAEALAAAQRSKDKIDEMRRILDGIAAKFGPDVERVGETLVVKDKLLFPLGSAEVSEEGKKLLQEVAAKFKDTNDLLQIDGHTDDVPVVKPETVAKFVNNWGLAAMRARAVLDLLAKYGIPERRLFLRAFGMQRPRVPNDTPENRAKNRRVEVVFIAGGAAAPAPEAPKPETPKPETPKPEAPKSEPAKPPETK